MSAVARIIVIAALVAAMAACQHSPVDTQRATARNVILFVGDGMSTVTVTAARIHAGQLAGGFGEEHQLAFERFPYVALSKTYNVDAQVADSAGTMTAMITGVKTDAGLIGMAEGVERGDCASGAGNELVSALELAELGGLATGIVTTARLTHATPAATYAKSVERGWEDDADMPADAVAAGCMDIAQQFVNFESRLEAKFPGVDVDGIEVALGGGRRNFLPADAAFNTADFDGAVEGARTDGKHLIEQWQANYPDGVFVSDRRSFDAIGESDAPVLGLFESSHARYHQDLANDIAGEPSLSEQTRFAIERLSRDPDGFFLVVEGGRIDHAHHAGNAQAALVDTIELARAVSVAAQLTQASETLIIVTADHAHTLEMMGYPPRGNPILGKIPVPGRSDPQLALDGMPYTTLAYANGRGATLLGAGDQPLGDVDVRYRSEIHGGRADLGEIDTTDPGYFQEALVPMQSETHGGDDVAIYASGPGAQWVQGVLEQNVIFHVMNEAAGLERKASARVAASRQAQDE